MNVKLTKVGRFSPKTKRAKFTFDVYPHTLYLTKEQWKFRRRFITLTKDVKVCTLGAWVETYKAGMKLEVAPVYMKVKQTALHSDGSVSVFAKGGKPTKRKPGNSSFWVPADSWK